MLVVYDAVVLIAAEDFGEPPRPSRPSSWQFRLGFRPSASSAPPRSSIFPGTGWGNWGSNPGPPHCERGSLPAELLPQNATRPGTPGGPARQRGREDTLLPPEVKRAK